MQIDSQLRASSFFFRRVAGPAGAGALAAVAVALETGAATVDEARRDRRQ